MEALEAEQKHVDNRADVVERKLRSLMETGMEREGQCYFKTLRPILPMPFKPVVSKRFYIYILYGQGNQKTFCARNLKKRRCELKNKI